MEVTFQMCLKMYLYVAWQGKQLLLSEKEHGPSHGGWKKQHIFIKLEFSELRRGGNLGQAAAEGQRGSKMSRASMP